MEHLTKFTKLSIDLDNGFLVQAKYCAFDAYFIYSLLNLFLVCVYGFNLHLMYLLIYFKMSCYVMN